MDEIILPLFPVHIAKTDNKYKENTMFKINNQQIYNGGLHKHCRAVVMNNMHNWIIAKMEQQGIEKYNFEIPERPVQLVVRIYTVLNHGNIRWSKKTKTANWKKPAEDYIPNWDEDNLAAIWVKAIKDALSKYGFWSDDNVWVCRGTDSLVEFVEDINDRRIEIKFKEL